MKYEEIQALLDRYWEGDTSLEEERRIKAYFNAGQIDARLQSFAPMFQAFREEQAVQLITKAKIAPMRPQMYQWAAAASIALILAAGWWMYQAEDKGTDPMANQTPVDTLKQVAPDQVPETQSQSNTLALVEKKAPIRPIKRRTPSTPSKPKPSIDPETAQAMAEIKAALALVSSKLDKGRNEAVKGATYLEAMDKVPKRKAG